MTIDSWAQGNVFKGTNSAGTFTQGNIASIPKAPAVLDSAGRIFGKSHPQYADYSPSDFVSVRSHGAKVRQTALPFIFGFLAHTHFTIG